MTDATPTPSAPTAEMLAQECKQLLDAYVHVYDNPDEGNDAASVALREQVHAIIDRLAALARSEPPTGELPLDHCACGDQFSPTWRGMCPGCVAAEGSRAHAPTGEPVAIPEGWKLVGWYDPDDFTRTTSRRTEKEHAPLYAPPIEAQAGEPKPLTEEQIDEMALQEQFLLICDGPEELRLIVREVERLHGIQEPKP